MKSKKAVEGRGGRSEGEVEIKRKGWRREKVTGRAWKWGMVNEGRVRKGEALRRGWTIREDASKGRRVNVGGGTRLEV